MFFDFEYASVEGSPPLTRGKEVYFTLAKPVLGITPAYAGKRLIRRLLLGKARDHPRLRGEKLQIALTVFM